MLKYELYKIFSRKIIYLALFIFLAGYLFWAGQYYSRVQPITAPDTLYRGWEGPVTEEKAEKAKEGLEEIQRTIAERFETAVRASSEGEAVAVGPDQKEYQLLGLYDKVLFAWHRLEKHNGNLTGLEQGIEEARGKGMDDFNFRQSALHYNMLSGLAPPAVNYNKAWGEIIDFIYSMGFVFMGAMILLGTSPVFAEEYSTNMDGLILSSKYGKKKVVTAKIAASIIVITITALLFTAVNVCANFYYFGNAGSGAALQELYKYIDSPYNLSLGQYYLVQLTTHIFGAAAFGLVVLLLSVFSRSALVPFFVGGFIFGAPIFLTKILRIETPWVLSLADFSYTQLMRVEDLFDSFRAFNIFGYPVLYPHVLFTFITVLSVAVFYFVYWGFRNRQVG